MIGNNNLLSRHHPFATHLIKRMLALSGSGVRCVFRDAYSHTKLVGGHVANRQSRQGLDSLHPLLV